MLLPILLLTAAIWLAYKYWVSTYNQWKRRGIPQAAGKFPFGSDIKMALMTEYIGYSHHKLYEKFSSQPYFGIYLIRIPFLVIRSPEIIGMILTKDFSHFRDRQNLKPNDSDILNQHLFNAIGDKWHAIRTKLSPTFTSGKLKAMLPVIMKSAENLDIYLEKKSGTSIEVKDLTARFTTDVICSCVFGVEANTIENPDNEIRKTGLTALNVSKKIMLKIIGISAFPEFINVISIKFTEERVEKFFVKFVNDSVKYRETNNIKRNDFLDLLIQLKNKDNMERIKDGQQKSLDMTPEVMAANSFVFFAAGFETSSSVQSFCMYELALNPHLQERLQNEIDDVLRKHNGLTYEGIKEMTYLDMVLKETLRKYPTLPNLMRVCTKALNLPDGTTIQKGDQMLIPVWSLHHDPQYFPEPEKFDPERFSEQNRDMVKPFTYLPFGEGPRICIGMRFGLLQTKIGIITILRRFYLKPAEDIAIPLGIKGPSFTTMPKDPINLKFIPR